MRARSPIFSFLSSWEISVIITLCTSNPAVRPFTRSFFFSLNALLRLHINTFTVCCRMNLFICSACCVLSFILFLFFFSLFIYFYAYLHACCIQHHALLWSSGSLNQARVGVTASRMRMPTHCSVLASHGSGYATYGASRSYMNH